MHRALIVGDMHVVPEELDDCNAVLQLIVQVCSEKDISEVWFSGDQHHTHSIVRLEVLHWWRNAFTLLVRNGLKVVCLVGNHDQASPGSDLNAMIAYRGMPNVRVVEAPVVYKGILFVPYIHDQDEFLRICKLHEAQTVFCHQTFDGSTYENGFLASDGFDAAQVPQELIISGHIHTGQEFGKVWYVGAPRWRSLSDANVPRALWAVEFNDGQLVDRLPFDTGAVCRQIIHRDDTVESPVALPLDLKHQWRIDIRGSQEWCQSRKKELSAAGARVRTFPTQTSVKGRVRESEGIDKAFKAFVGAFQGKYGTSRELLETMAKERLNT